MEEKQKQKKNARKKKNGIWFNDTTTIENFHKKQHPN